MELAQVCGATVVVAHTQKCTDELVRKLEGHRGDGAFGLSVECDQEDGGEQRLELVVVTATAPFPALGPGQHEQLVVAIFQVALTDGHFPLNLLYLLFANPWKSFVTLNCQAGGHRSLMCTLERELDRCGMHGMLQMQRHFDLWGMTQQDNWLELMYGPHFNMPPRPVGKAWLVSVMNLAWMIEPPVVTRYQLLCKLLHPHVV